MRKRVSLLSAAALLSGLAACSNGPMSHEDDFVTVESVSPANGSVVTTTTVVSVSFSHAMMLGMETLVVLHEGSVTGPVVSGSPSWSADRRTLTFTPLTALKGATTYVLHLAPGLRSADGLGVNHGSCSGLGGRTVGSGMMGSGGIGGVMMGPGWKAADGTYGMIFTFTTS